MFILKASLASRNKKKDLNLVIENQIEEEGGR